MNFPRLAILVHGGPSSIEAVRATGLAMHWPEDRRLFLWRTDPRNRVPLAWWRALRQWTPEVVYVLNTAMPGALLAPLWNRFNHKPYAIDTGDVIHEMAVRSGVPARWKRPALGWFERLAQRQAAAIVVRGTRHREYLQGRGYADVTVIRDGFRPAAPREPAAVPALREKLGLQGFWVLGVLGSLVYSPRLGLCYGWDLVEALVHLRDLPLRGLVVGDGSGRAWLEKRAEALGVLNRIVFTGRVPYEEVPLHLALMDFALSTQTNNLPGQVRTTGKLPEYMAAGRFILASRVGEAELLLPEIMLVNYDGEVDSEYPGRLATRIRRIILDPELLDARNLLPGLAQEHCSYPVLAGRFETVIRRIATRTGNGR